MIFFFFFFFFNMNFQYRCVQQATTQQTIDVFLYLYVGSLEIGRVKRESPSGILFLQATLMDFLDTLM